MLQQRYLVSCSPGVMAGEPEPTKVLEIISLCNWESHRSLVLKELFRCINMNCLSSAFSVDIYRVELLSENLKTDNSRSMITYKVCVSLAKPEQTHKAKQNATKPKDAPSSGNSSSQEVDKLNDECVNDSLNTLERNAPDEPQAKHFPLLSRVVPAGYLKADKTTLVGSGPIKVKSRKAQIY